MPAGESPRAAALLRWCALAVLLTVLACLWTLAARRGADSLGSLLPLIGLSLFAVGRFVIFGGLIEGAYLGPWGLAAMVVLLDLCVALVLSAGAPALERLPWVGVWTARARRRAERVLEEYPRLESLAFAGILLFVFLPIAATGAVTGFFAARIVGVTRVGGLAAIGLGSGLSAACFALLAQLLGERGEELLMSPTLAAVSLLALAVFARIAYLRVTRLLRGGPRPPRPKVPPEP